MPEPRLECGVAMIWFVLCFLTAVVVGLASAQAPVFYAQLSQPLWAPPAWVFGPVWTVLYVMMALAAWLVWRQRSVRPVGPALGLFAVQLVFNAAWSWLFFAWQTGGWAMLDIVLLWVTLCLTLVRFWQIQRMAGLLLVPYLLWVTFAAALNYRIWQLNPVLLGA